MKVEMVMVSSINGRITRDNEENIYSWTSEEDQGLFFSMIMGHNLIVMGSKTYQAAKDKIKLSPDKLRVVLTRTPKKYKDDFLSGQLEFSDEEPRKLVERLEGLGYKSMLLVGGGEINSLFLGNSLVDEIHLTLEPWLFGSGRDFLSETNLNIPLNLIHFERLNNKGTLYLRYRVIKSIDI